MFRRLAGTHQLLERPFPAPNYLLWAEAVVGRWLRLASFLLGVMLGWNRTASEDKELTTVPCLFQTRLDKCSALTAFVNVQLEICLTFLARLSQLASWCWQPIPRNIPSSQPTQLVFAITVLCSFSLKAITQFTLSFRPVNSAALPNLWIQKAISTTRVAAGGVLDQAHHELREDGPLWHAGSQGAEFDLFFLFFKLIVGSYCFVSPLFSGLFCW